MTTKNLLIVESPAKCATILQYLDPTYTIVASYGHVRKLVNNVRAIDVNNQFALELYIPADKTAHVARIIEAVKQAQSIYLATDYDREGEGIAWHLQDLLQPYLHGKQIQRITFNEITAPAILQALQSPRPLDANLVDAYKARMILDFLVGFHISPVLWRRIGGTNLSAGRVQSPSLRLMAERQDMITSFTPCDFWTIAVDTPIGSIQLQRYDDNPYTPLADEATALTLQQRIQQACPSVIVQTNVKKKKQIKAPLPLITSTLQRKCFQLFRMSSSQTMQIAQQLYEGIITPTGHMALITYMRTDALSLAQEAQAMLQAYVTQEFGAADVQPYSIKTKVKGAQEAHEAIRPTQIQVTPAQLKSSLTKQQYQVYDLIWRRALASQMISATTQTQTLTCTSADQTLVFKHTSSIILVLGWQKVYTDDEAVVYQKQHPVLAPGDIIQVKEVKSVHDTTKPPAPYNDASLIKKLEALGIGRPSTYAAIAPTLLKREYITTEKNKGFGVTPKGEKIITFLKKHFSGYVNYQFTAMMEKKLDAIATGQLEMQAFIEDFWVQLKQNIDTIQAQTRVVTIVPDSVCPLCQSNIEEREGRYGTYHCCTLYPATCTYNYNLKKNKPELLERCCPTCQSPLCLITTIFGQFIGCQSYPKCKYKETVPLPGVLCPKCSQHNIVKKLSKRGVFYACQGYPACKNAYPFPPRDRTCVCGAIVMLQLNENTFKCTQCSQVIKDLDEAITDHE